MGDDLEGYADEAEVARVVGAKAVLEEYLAGADIPNLVEFRQAAAALTSNLLVNTLIGKYGEPKSPKDALDTANKVMDLVTKRDLAALGDELAKLDDPGDRKALFDEFKAKAIEARKAQK